MPVDRSRRRCQAWRASRTRAPQIERVAVRLSSGYTAFGRVAREIDQSGADGLVLFNRFYQPDLDVEALTVAPTASMRDNLSFLRVPDPEAYECAHYMLMLQSWRGVRT